MRHLVQPRTLNLAGAAAFLSALACYPRFLLWDNRAAPIWYLEAVIFFCAIVLWSFVFAWHTVYTQCPVFTLRQDPRRFAMVTAVGVVVAIGLHLFLDPSLRSKMPEDYPANPMQWFALISFSLAFSQLFLIFAPFAWLIRLLKNRRVAALLTVLFGVVILAVRTRHAPVPIPPALLAGLLAVRLVMGSLAVAFYLRGGVLLSWWWTLIIESRHWLDLANHS